MSVRRNVHPPNHQSRETETRQSCSTRVDDVKSEDENDYGDDYYHENANTNATAHAYLMLLQARLARQRRRRLRRRLHQLEPIEAADGQPGGTTESVLGGGRFGSMRIVRRGSNGRGVAAAIVSRADSDPGLKDDGDIYADLDVDIGVDDDDDVDDDREDDIKEGDDEDEDSTHDIDDDCCKGGCGGGGGGDSRRRKEEARRGAREAARKATPRRAVYGAIVSGEDRLLLAMELLPAADLHVLLDKAERRLSREHERGIAGDVCAGMTFLRSETAADGDLVSSHTVLNGTGRAKV